MNAIATHIHTTPEERAMIGLDVEHATIRSIRLRDGLLTVQLRTLKGSIIAVFPTEHELAKLFMNEPETHIGTAVWAHMNGAKLIGISAF